jgi:hypothetical protein
VPGLREAYPWKFEVNTWRGVLRQLIIFLNDDMRYDRRRIADIVESLGY